MTKAEGLARYRDTLLKEIERSEESIAWLSDPDIKMTRTEGTQAPEDLKAILLADYKRTIDTTKQCIVMVDEMLSGSPRFL
ncbi:hypothetical protein NKH23_28065 [Mesorhizobium sp. M1328]|uniref:hypothetical protein n=1 Tax=Mesorhizobium sp. M1328 TaxID=2957082 RepID=UPI0033360FD2